MRTAKFAIVLLVGVGSILTVFGMSHVILVQENDDYLIISQQTTMKQRRDFFQTLSPERKSALWRKHYSTELVKHPDLTPDQKAVVDLAMVIVSPDLFRDNLPDACAAGSVFRTAGENAFKDAPSLRIEIFGQPAGPLPKLAHAKTSQGWPDCECNAASWCNSCVCECGAKGPAGDCTGRNTGCGCWWQQPCDHMCGTCW